MVTIRLARAGARNRPYYHVVAAEKKFAVGGRFLENLGHYNPKASGKEPKLVVDTARVEHWTKQGAQMSERVAYLLKHVAGKAEAKAA